MRKVKVALVSHKKQSKATKQKQTTKMQQSKITQNRKYDAIKQKCDVAKL